MQIETKVMKVKKREWREKENVVTSNFFWCSGIKIFSFSFLHFELFQTISLTTKSIESSKPKIKVLLFFSFEHKVRKQFPSTKQN